MRAAYFERGGGRQARERVSGKLPYMKFYPGDWLKDPALRACSPEARALWIDLLCLMWECPRRGYLKTGKEPWGILEIANALSSDPASIQNQISELKSRGVLRQTRVGVLYSKRITRDEKTRKYWTRKQKEHRDKSGYVKPMSTVSSEVISHSSEVRSKSSSDDDVFTLLPELQRRFPNDEFTEKHLSWAVQRISERAGSPPVSRAYWRKSLVKFFGNWEAELAAWEKEQAGAIEAHAGHNPHGRAN